MTTPVSSPVVVLGISGSIAAYKAADIASKLRKAGCEVFAVMTRHATEFITPLTLHTITRQPVVVNLFDEADSWQPGHIDLADRAALFLVAPATANTLAKLSYGLADDALSSIALATRAPILIAPAMNGHMWQHPATRENVDRLTARGVQFIGPEEGMLACGYEGIGRLWNTDDIVDRALNVIRGDLQVP